MKSLMLFLRCVLNDLGTRCGISTNFDLKTIEARFEDEGLSFLTITLSNFGKDLEKGLDQGYVDSTLFLGFKRKGGLPVFLRGFLSLIFDSGTGRLLDYPSIDAIYSLRQFLLMWSKMNLMCSDTRVRSALKGYIECEQIVRISDANLRESEADSFIRVKRLLFNEILSDVSNDIFSDNILGKHGPGSTADRVVGNNKYDLKEWTARLEAIFPYGIYGSASWSQILETPPNYLEPGQERPVRVTPVPKTQKTPRLIAIEPLCMQFMQQALLESILRAMESGPKSGPGPYLNPYQVETLIGWGSQLPNQQMALQGSRDGTLATLDLSEASDRVSYQHVRLLLTDFPLLLEAVDSCRSRKADVDGYGVIRLAKFASMGSALCFPFESMVFMVIVFLGIEKVLNRHITKKDILSFLGQVRTYGDDIIVPTGMVHSVVSELETFGLKVNANKSFWTGKFRESCGKDYYDGHDISVVKVRQMIPTQRKHVAQLISTVSLRNQLYDRGFVSAVSYLDKVVKGFIPFPYVSRTAGCLGRYTDSPLTFERWDNRLQRPLIKAAKVQAIIPRNEINGYPALLKFYLKRGDKPFDQVDHLIRAGRAKSVRIKISWTCPL